MSTPTRDEMIEALPDIIPDVVKIVYEYVGRPFIIKAKYAISFTFSAIKLLVIDGCVEYIPDPNNDSNRSPNLKPITGVSTNIFEDHLVHTICIYGASGLSFENNEYPIEIVQWGDYKMTKGYRIFGGCAGILITATDSPNIKTKSMAYMFAGTLNISGNLNWNTRWITDMSHMFYGCDNFNGDISDWNTGNVGTMNSMFSGCIKFDADLSRWDTSEVTTMNSMFNQSTSFNGDLSRWKTGKVRDASHMFNRCFSFNGDLSRWDTSSVVYMAGMFLHCSEFNQDLSGWSLANVINMTNMFGHCLKFNKDLRLWDMSNVKYMAGMFYGCAYLSLNLDNWNIRKAVDISYMLKNCHNMTMPQWNPPKHFEKNLEWKSLLGLPGGK